MADQDWPYGYEVVTARDANGRNAVPTRIGLKRVRDIGLVIAADCGNQEITFPMPDAAKFIGAMRQAIEQRSKIAESEQP